MTLLIEHDRLDVAHAPLARTWEGRADASVATPPKVAAGRPLLDTYPRERIAACSLAMTARSRPPEAPRRVDTDDATRIVECPPPPVWQTLPQDRQRGVILTLEHGLLPPPID
jgi:hypothetical protein